MRSSSGGSKIGRSIRTAARNRAESTLQKEFSAGKKWVLLCADASIPVKSLDQDERILTSQDVTAIAMELGFDGVLLNTGIAGARDPVRMALAMKAAVEAGHDAFHAGRIPRKLYATASSPISDLIAPVAR